jgi:hypothetical protein
LITFKNEEKKMGLSDWLDDEITGMGFTFIFKN